MESIGRFCRVVGHFRAVRRVGLKSTLGNLLYLFRLDPRWDAEAEFEVGVSSQYVTRSLHWRHAIGADDSEGWTPIDVKQNLVGAACLGF